MTHGAECAVVAMTVVSMSLLDASGANAQAIPPRTLSRTIAVGDSIVVKRMAPGLWGPNVILSRIYSIGQENGPSEYA